MNDEGILVRRLSVVALFLAARLPLFFLRKPFYDELFTAWIAAKPFAEIVTALHHDSGPPLYYFAVHLFGHARLLSLVCAGVTFLLVMRRSLIAALLLTLYPAAALMAVDGRAYAMCGMFVAVGVVALEEDHRFAGALAFVLAAYTHYYGVLFFPLLLLRGRRGLGPFALAAILFAPGFLLALHQPAEAMAWNAFPPMWSLANLSFAGHYADGLLTSPPLAVVIGAMVMFIFAACRSWRFAPAVLIPLTLTLLFAAAGRSIYFPLRFESVIAAPLVLWLAASLARWPSAVRTTLAAALALTGALVLTRGTLAHAYAGESDGVRAARLVRARVPAGEPVVASGYNWLEAQSVLPRVTAFPLEQAQHPGWWRPLPAYDTRNLPADFVWIGNAEAPELAALRRVRRALPLGQAGNVVILRMRVLTTALH
jgi:hypothetical protein